MRLLELGFQIFGERVNTDPTVLCELVSRSPEAQLLVNANGEVDAQVTQLRTVLRSYEQELVLTGLATGSVGSRACDCASCEFSAWMCIRVSLQCHSMRVFDVRCLWDG